MDIFDGFSILKNITVREHTFCQDVNRNPILVRAEKTTKYRSDFVFVYIIFIFRFKGVVICDKTIKRFKYSMYFKMKFLRTTYKSILILIVSQFRFKTTCDII